MIAPLDMSTARPTDPDARQVVDPYSKSQARRAKLAITWETKAEARDMAPHLKSLVYVDNLSGAADDLQLEFEDRDALWSGDWQPTFGDHVVARIEAEPWFGSGDKVKSLRLGKFSHDKISIAFGQERTVRLSCVSAPLSTGLRRRKRTKTWAHVTLQKIAQDIADRSSMRLDFDGAAGPAYKHAQQSDKSDLEFLQDECEKVGRTVKVTEDTIAIYDEQKIDQRDAVGDIDIIGGWVLGGNFDADDSGRYGSCHVSCFNPSNGKLTHHQYPPDGVTVEGLDPNGQTLEMKISVSDVAEAQVRAQKLLRAANRFATSGKLTTVGDPGLVAGVVFNLTNANKLSGKFIITRAEHHPVGGYTCNLTVRRCVENY